MSDGFGLDHLPYGVFVTEGSAPRVGVRYGDKVVDVATVRPELDRPSLNPFMALGPDAWAETRAQITELVESEALPALPLDAASLLLPFEVGDYVDFYASLDHASNVGRIFRPDQEPLLPNWRHLPVGYHGRSGTVVVSGTPVVRPCGQRKSPAEQSPTYGPSLRLDIEAELGFVVGVGTELGSRVPVEDFPSAAGLEDRDGDRVGDGVVQVPCDPDSFGGHRRLLSSLRFRGCSLDVRRQASVLGGGLLREDGDRGEDPDDGDRFHEREQDVVDHQGDDHGHGTDACADSDDHCGDRWSRRDSRVTREVDDQLGKQGNRILRQKKARSHRDVRKQRYQHRGATPPDQGNGGADVQDERSNPRR